jgi:sortase A
VEPLQSEPSHSAKPINRFNQIALIIAGIAVILFALLNLLFDLGVVSQEDLETLRVRILYTATPTVVVQYRPGADGITTGVDPQVTSIVPTKNPQPTPVLITTEDSGFLPLQIEQLEIEQKQQENAKDETPLVVPNELIIPSINLDAPIIQAEQDEIITDGVTYAQWQAPNEFAGGWHRDSAGLGQVGNTVINGHHNINGEVFKDLDKLTEGERISVYGEDGNRYSFLVTNVMILEERDAPLEQRLENARWILPSDDERLTLITCWPYYSNTHRLVIVAKPLETDSFQHAQTGN